jgi:hypothetical protein
MSALPSVLISNEGTGKNQVQPDQESVGDATVLLDCFSAKKSLNNSDRCVGALS